MNAGTIAEHAESIQGQLNSAIAEEKSYIDQIETLRNEVDQYEKLRAIAEKAWKDDEARLIEDKKTIENFIAPLREELAHLNTEVSASVTLKANLKLENARLHEENTKVKAYETQAWKILTAKETELLAREKAIEQKEVLKPRSKSLLPPIQ